MKHVVNEVESHAVNALDATDFGDALSETKQGGPPVWPDGQGTYGLAF